MSPYTLAMICEPAGLRAVCDGLPEELFSGDLQFLDMALTMNKTKLIVSVWLIEPCDYREYVPSVKSTVQSFTVSVAEFIM
jgi:hypothetical protein